MPNPQHAILTDLQKYQWYTHMSRVDGADLGVIKDALKKARIAGDEVGVTSPLNVCLLFGPTLLADLTNDMPEDFQPYPGYKSSDGKEAKATQEELLLWIHSDDKDICWETQFRFRNAVKGHMDVPRGAADFHLPHQPRPPRLHRRPRHPGARAPVRQGHRPRRAA